MKRTSAAPSITSRWDYALTCKLPPKTDYQRLEEIRLNLFDYLEILATDPYGEKESQDFLYGEIQRVADRLKLVTYKRGQAAALGLKQGRLTVVLNPRWKG